MIGPCEHCPVASGECLGLSHRPACDDVRAGKPGRAAQLVALAGGHPFVAAVPDPGTPPRVPVDVGLRVLRCPHKAPPICACNAYAHCGLGKGDAGRVAFEDCVRCVGHPTGPGGATS